MFIRGPGGLIEMKYNTKKYKEMIDDLNGIGLLNK
jgi:hypothetical protein